jgi:hypothetical protein
MSGSCRPIIRLFALAFVLGLPADAAEEDPKEPVPPARPRLSPEAWVALKARLAPYTPPAEASAVDDKPVEGVAEMRDNVLHLPTMRVEQLMKLPPDSTDWLTAKGRLDLARKKYPGTKIGNILGLNDGWALARLEEQIAWERRSALLELGDRTVLDETEYDRETQRLLIRAAVPMGRPPPER